MITVDQLPEKSIDAARLAMAEALAADGDGIPECIVAAINALGADVAPAGCKRLFFVPHIILPLPTETSHD